MKTRGSRQTGLLALIGLAGAMAYSARGAFPGDRYDVILDRKPFGTTTAASAQAQAGAGPSFADSLRLSAIYEMNSVYRVGLIDRQSNRSLTLGVGQSDEGVELVSVDPAKEEAVVRKNGETGLLRLESGAPATVSSPTSPASVRPAPPGSPQPAVQNVVRGSPTMEGEQLQNRRRKLLAEFRDRIESQRAAQAQANTAPAGGTTRTMILSSPGASGQVTISTSGGGSGQVMLKVNGEAVELSE